MSLALEKESDREMKAALFLFNAESILAVDGFDWKRSYSEDFKFEVEIES